MLRLSVFVILLAARSFGQNRITHGATATRFVTPKMTIGEVVLVVWIKKRPSLDRAAGIPPPTEKQSRIQL